MWRVAGIWNSNLKMNSNFTFFTSRRRKLNIEEVCCGYSEPPTKAKKTSILDKQIISSGMDVDMLSMPPQGQFPDSKLSSFPSNGVDSWMPSYHLPVFGTAQSTPAAVCKSSSWAWSQERPRVTSAVILDNNTEGATSVNPVWGSYQGAVQPGHGVTAQCELAVSQRGECTECLAGKSGHFLHIQKRLRESQDC